MPDTKFLGFLLSAILPVLPLMAPAAESPPAAGAPSAPTPTDTEKTPATDAAERAEKAAEAAKAFESLYGADLKRVKATSSSGDDIQLAKQLMSTAQQASNQPEFQAILYDKAIDLTMAGPEGYPVAAQAIEQLAGARPDRATWCAEKMLEVRQRQFDTAAGDARAAAGEGLISAIMALVDGRTKGDVEKAALYKRAQAVARAIKSPRTEEVDSRAAALAQTARTAREIADAKVLIEKDPANARIRERLVRLYLADLDNPAEAARYLDGVADASLKKYVPAAAKPVEEAPEMASLELGEWYRVLGETAPAEVRAAMFARARAYYERFLALHTAQDLDRTRATVALQKLGSAAAPAPPKPAKPAPAKPAKHAKDEPGTFPPGQWIDMPTIVDPLMDCNKGECERRGTGLRLFSKAGGQLTVPLTAQGDYEAEFAFKRTWGPGEVTFHLPVGSTDVVLILSGTGGAYAGLSSINGKSANNNETRVAPSKLENERVYAVAVKVKTAGDQATVEATLDGKPYVSWTGPQSALSGGADDARRSHFRIALYGAGYTFDKARVKMLSGEAKFGRPAKASPASDKP